MERLGDPWHRINVVGVAGSGKTTFSRQLATRLGHQYIEMDALFWQPGWIESERAVFRERLEQAIAAERWVLDGNCSRTIPVKWARATSVIWLDYSLPRALSRVLRRTVRRSWTKEELWAGPGNRESFARMFARQSIVLWTLTQHARSRSENQQRMRDPAFRHLRFVHLRSPREAQFFLENLSA